MVWRAGTMGNVLVACRREARKIMHSQVKERPLFTVTYLFIYVRVWEQRIRIGHMYESEAE